MALRYRINLIRDRVEARARAGAISRVLSISMVVFGVMLIATMAAYLARDYQVTVHVKTIQHLFQSMAEKSVNPDEIAFMRARTKRVTGRLNAVDEVLRNAISWPDVLLQLASCCKRDGVVVKRISAQSSPAGAMLVLEGLCVGENPIQNIHAFLGHLPESGAFGRGRRLTIHEDKQGGHTFETLIPLAEYEIVVPSSPPAAKAPPAKETRQARE